MIVLLGHFFDSVFILAIYHLAVDSLVDSKNGLLDKTEVLFPEWFFFFFFLGFLIKLCFQEWSINSISIYVKRGS